jgi:hypothetical protein
VAIQNLPHLGSQELHVTPYEDIRTNLNCHRPLRVLADCQTRHAKVSGLFLNAAGIGDDDRRILLQRKKLEVTDGF